MVHHSWVIDPANLRRHRRVIPHVSSPVEVQIMGDGFMELLLARDLSSGGLSVYVSHDFAGCNIDSQVHLIIKLGKLRPFSALGVIRHRNNGQNNPDAAHFFGVQFTQVSDDNRKRLEGYVAKRVAEGGGA